MRSFQSGLFHLLLVSTLLLPACSSVPSRAPSAVPTSNSAEIPSKSGHPGSSKPSTSNSPVKPDPYQIQTRLTDFEFLDDQTGYAWGVTAQELRLYRSTDGGKTWANVSPPENEMFPVPPQYERNLYFFDKENGWIVKDEFNDQKPVVLHTVNSGVTWSRSIFPEKTHITAIQFINPKKGWLLCSADSGMSHSEKSLYVTTDGGKTWKKIMQNTGYIPTKDPTQGAIPQVGYATGIAFQDENNGWITLNSPAGAALYRTQNGGSTWGRVPAISSGKQDEYTLTWNPVFFGHDKKTGWFPVAYEQPKQIWYHGYFTNDGGKHWQDTRFGVKPLHQMTEKAPFVFVSRSEGWFIDQNLVYHTVDGGKSWALFNQDAVLAQTVKQYPQLTEVQFTSGSTGWMLLQTEDHQKSLLLKTEDGGKSWRVI